MSRLTRRKKKKARRHAFWKIHRAYDVHGGDKYLWAAHGNPVVTIACSNCYHDAPTVRGHEEDTDIVRWALLKKKCPHCGYRMDF